MLSARLTLAGPAQAAVRTGTPIAVALRITNTGNSSWIGGNSPTRGWTRVGAHLYRSGSSRELINYDWWRGDLPGKVEPGAEIAVQATLPPIGTPGRHDVVFDVVVEGLTWLASRGSIPAVLSVDVS